jgi:putative photosynthetic complex assembly protein 2
MSEYVFPVLYTLFVWWFSTGVILYLDGLPRWTHRWTMLLTTQVLVFALYALAQTRSDTSVLGAYLAFTCGVLVWAWQEVGFLLGFLTGPRRSACPQGARGWPRFRFALETIWHHELALVAMAAIVFAVVSDGPNQIGLKTYLLLWVMRQSAKLNLFFGVRNLSEEFLPDHLQYLASYYRRRPMNAFYPLSVALATILVIFLGRAAGATGASPATVTGLVFLVTLLSLAILEHGFLMLPLPTLVLWNWSLKSRAPALDERPAEESPRRVAVGLIAAHED